MVDVAAYTWVEFETTTTAVLYGTQLNCVLDYVSAIVNKGITGAQLANSAVTTGNLGAVVVTEGAINYTHTQNGVGAWQCGKDRATYQQAAYVGAAAVTTLTDAANTNVTFYFTNCDCCTAGEPVFSATPYVGATVVTNDTGFVCHVSAVATDSCLVYLSAAATTQLPACTVRFYVAGNV